VVKYLKRRFYHRQALPPFSSTIGITKKNSPTLKSIERKRDYTSLYYNNLENYHYVLIYSYGKTIKDKYPVKKLLTRAFVNTKTHFEIPTELIRRKKQVALLFVDKKGHESESKIIHLKQTN